MAAPTLLVLAAGMGSRYGRLKQIDPVEPGGETLMDYSIFDARRAGFGKVVFVIRKEIELAFQNAVAARYEKRIGTEYVFQELRDLPAGFSLPKGRTKPWGTTHAILMAADTIREPFAVINADDFYGERSFRALAQYLNSNSSVYAMVGFKLRDTLSEFGGVARGVCHVDAEDYLRDITELKSIEREGDHAVSTDAGGQKTVLTGEEVVSMNMWGFTPQVFPQLREHFQRFLLARGTDLNAECYIPTAVNEMIALRQARVKVLNGGGLWFGLTYRDDLPAVVETIRRLTEQGAYPRDLWK